MALSSSCTFIALNCEKKYIHQLNNQLFYTFLFNLNSLIFIHLSLFVFQMLPWDAKISMYDMAV